MSRNKHCWHEFCKVVEASPMIGGALAGQVKYTLGTVEFEDGSIEEVAPHRIVFEDNRVKAEWGEWGKKDGTEWPLPSHRFGAAC